MKWIKEKWADIRRLGMKQAIRYWKSENHLNTNAWFDVLSWDEENKRYRLDRTTCKERDVPGYVLPVTGDKHHYLTVMFKLPDRAVKKDNGCYHTSAISNYLYYRSNAINDAMASVWKPRAINLKALIIVGIGGVIAVYIATSMGLF